jgi:hypothetical protein
MPSQLGYNVTSRRDSRNGSTPSPKKYLCCYAWFFGYKIYLPGRSGLLHMVGHSLEGGKSEENRLKISTRRRYFSERNRQFVQWLFYPLWLVPFTTAANLIVLIVEAIVLSVANRKLSLIWDIYICSKAGALARPGTIRSARKLLCARAVPFSVFFTTFTAIPPKLRLLNSSGLPRA